MKNIVVVIAIGIALSACGPAQETQNKPPTVSAAPAAKPPAPPPPENLRAAIATTRPFMADTRDGDFDKGSAALAIWSTDRLKWSELQEIPSGKYALVMKDSDSQRGSRICTGGRIIEITVDNTVPGSKVFLGGMYDDAGHIYRFIAVRSTGEIVANSRAKFCGIVTGQQHYRNSAGGVAHAVHLVGMFDLPENKNN